jgi:hypothetical protein
LVDRLHSGSPGANAGKFTVASLAENQSYWPGVLMGVE